MLANHYTTAAQPLIYGAMTRQNIYGAVTSQNIYGVMTIQNIYCAMTSQNKIHDIYKAVMQRTGTVVRKSKQGSSVFWTWTTVKQGRHIQPSKYMINFFQKT